MDYDLRKEQISIAEQGFIENHFCYGSGLSFTKENYLKSIDLLVSSYYHADELSEKITDGEAVDPPTLNQSVQELIFSYRHAERFRNDLSGSKIVNPLDISVSSNLEDNVAKGETFLKRYEESSDFDDYESGKWYLGYCKAINK